MVAAGLAERVEVQLSYAIGVAYPTSVSVETFGTGVVDDDVIVGLINSNFDLRPGAIINNLDCESPSTGRPPLTATLAVRTCTYAGSGPTKLRSCGQAPVLPEAAGG